MIQMRSFFQHLLQKDALTKSGLAENLAEKGFRAANMLVLFLVMMEINVLLVIRKVFNYVFANVTKNCAIVPNLSGNVRTNVEKSWLVDTICVN